MLFRRPRFKAQNEFAGESRGVTFEYPLRALRGRLNIEQATVYKSGKGLMRNSAERDYMNESFARVARTTLALYLSRISSLACYFDWAQITTLKS